MRQSEPREQVPLNKYLSLVEYQDNDELLVQCNINNYRANSQIKAYDIRTRLEQQFNINNLQISIMKLEIKFKDDDSNEAGTNFRQESGFNQYRNSEFFMQLLSPKSLNQQNENARTLMEEIEEESPNEIEGQTQNQINDFLQQMMVINYRTDDLIRKNLSTSERREKLKDDYKQFLSTIKRQHDIVNENSRSNVNQRVIVIVTLQGKVREFKKLSDLDRDIPIPIQNDQNLYLRLNTMRVCDQIYRKEFAAKLGKEKSPISSFQFGELKQTQEIKISKDDQQQIPVTFLTYFDSQNFNQLLRDFDQMPNDFQQDIFFYKDEHKHHRKLELFLTCWQKYYIKIDLQMEFLQYAFSEEKGDDLILYFKLLTPPFFQISKVDQAKYELPNYKEDWIRVHNFILDCLISKQFIDHLQRLHYINNTAIRIVINKKNRLEFNLITNRIQQFPNIWKINQFQLSNSDQINYIKKPELTCACLNSSELDFGTKYNLLTIISENKMLIYELKAIYAFLIKQKKNELDVKRYIKIMESAFQSFCSLRQPLSSKDYPLNLAKEGVERFKTYFKKAKNEILFLTMSAEDQFYRLGFIRRLTLTPSGILYVLKEPEQTNKIIRDYRENEDYFMRLHFEDENRQMLKSMSFICEIYFKQQLTDGVQIFERNYELLTWSSSQLRASSCWLTASAQVNLPRQQIINNMGVFRGISSVAKYAARLGQQFSSSIPFRLPEQLSILQINDEGPPKVEQADGQITGVEYTDGIGKISKNLMELIQQNLSNKQITAIQIRFGGAKGVLVQDERLTDNIIILRKSMVKFIVHGNKYGRELEILDYNKYRGGYLNRQIIMLLITLGVPYQPFLDIQTDYIKSLENIQYIDASIYKYFNVDYKGELLGLQSVVTTIQKMINSQIEPQHNLFIKGCISRLKNRGLLILRTKANILVNKAARLLGIIDEFDVLKENEIYAQYSFDGQTVTPVIGVGDDQKVFVTRNPCIHPGDIRVLRAVTPEEIKARMLQRNPDQPNLVKNVFADYHNCVVFPKKGKVPLTTQMAGGDLDGDLYFICWDERLIPPRTIEPFGYDLPPPVRPRRSFNERAQNANQGIQDFTVQDLLDFMLHYLTSDTLGKIDNSHLAISEHSEDNAMDSRAMQLAELHSKAVDYVKSGEEVKIPKQLVAKEWPDYMEKDKLSTFEGRTVIGMLYREVKNIIKNTQGSYDSWNETNTQRGLPPYDMELMYGYKNLMTSLASHGIEIQMERQQLQNQVQQTDGQRDELINQFIEKNYQPRFFKAIQVTSQVFYMLNGLMRLYDIGDEYEIYSGNISKLTSGDEIHHKQKFNVDNIQKKIIQKLIEINFEIQNLFQDEIMETRLKTLSIIYFMMNYTPNSHCYRPEEIRGQFLHLLFKSLSQTDSYIKFSKIFYLWFRGFPWFFFSEDLLKIKNLERNQQVFVQALDINNQITQQISQEEDDQNEEDILL